MPPYDALLLISFGGPEGPDDVMPFLENVTRGKNVPRERLLEVAAHYDLFDGVSPLGDECRGLLSAIVQELNRFGPRLPVYWANRHWHPLLPEVFEQMAEDGIHSALALVTSAFGSPPGCRAYLDAIEAARAEVGPDAPQVSKLRLYFNHPGFLEPMAQRVAAVLDQIPEDRRKSTAFFFTAHSIPVAMAAVSPYEGQLREACRVVAELANVVEWELAYQSRSGPPAQPWLGPDIQDAIRQRHAQGGLTDCVVAPIGFVCDHMEVVYDLDVEVRTLCDDLGLAYHRAGTVGSHPRFVRMIRELVVERLDHDAPRLALGDLPPWPDACPENCCRIVT